MRKYRKPEKSEIPEIPEQAGIIEYELLEKFLLQDEIKGKTVLIVDDSKLYRLSLNYKLKDLPCKIAEAANVEAALKFLNEHLNELFFIITGIRFPDGMSGHDFVHNIKSNPKLKHILMIMHGVSLFKPIPPGKRADGYLWEPYGQKDLFLKMAEILERQALLKKVAAI